MLRYASRGSDLYYHAAISRQHSSERAKRTINATKVRHFSHSAVFVRLHFFHRREDGNHSVVDPYIDRPEFSLDRRGVCLDLLRVGDVGGQHQRPAATVLNVSSCASQSVFTSGDQADLSVASCECLYCSPSDACRGPGNYHYLAALMITIKS